uniref:Cytokinin riboside 5'-monophosphate phosphoribohydrolase LOG8 n=1 Tax=Noccaea caerulescens TaxID=107243 RepID=A0A1J3E7E7_NOCCA
MKNRSDHRWRVFSVNRLSPIRLGQFVFTLEILEWGETGGVMHLFPDDAVSSSSSSSSSSLPVKRKIDLVYGETIGDVRIVEDMDERKAAMAQEAEAFIALFSNFKILESVYKFLGFSIFLKMLSFLFLYEVMELWRNCWR